MRSSSVRSVFPSIHCLAFGISLALVILPLLCGEMAAAQQIRLSTPRQSVSFPSTTVGATSTSVTIPLQVYMDGTIITSISAPPSLGAQQEYAVQSIGCALNTPLPVGTTCNIAVTFTPAIPGLRSTPLQVAIADNNFNFGMEGLGVGPLVTLSPAIITTFAGNGNPAFAGDGGPAADAGITEPFAAATDSFGNLYIVDGIDNVIRKITAGTGIISTIAGSSSGAGFSGDNGPAVDAYLNSPAGVAVDSAGNLYIADTVNSFIRKVSASTGYISTFVGLGHFVGRPPGPPTGYSGDGGSARTAELNGPAGLAFDSTDDLYIADSSNHVIRRVDATTNIITTVAGNHTAGYSGDGGPATGASLHYPNGVAIDSLGNIFIADISNHVIRKVSAATGIITTVAGTGTRGFSGDGGPATSAQLNLPSNVSVDTAGNIYIADTENNRIREVDAGSGIIATIAGNGKTGFDGDTYSATGAELNQPSGVAVDNVGNVYIADSSNNRIRKINVLDSQLYFAQTPIGFSSLDSPQTATVTNIGNAPLIFSVPTSGFNPSISPNFTFNSGTTCPQVSNSSITQSLAAGISCNLQISFTPIQTGTISGTADISDNALTTPPFLQTVHLNGFGLPASAGRPDFSLSVTPSTQTIADGTTATYIVTATAIYGFTGSVALVATGVPASATANFNPANIAVSGASGSSSFTISVPRTVSTSRPGENPFPRGSSALHCGLLFLAFPLLGIARKQIGSSSITRKSSFLLFLLISLTAATFGMTGCANIGLELQPHSYNITITGTAYGVPRSTTLTLTAVGYQTVKYH